MKSSIAFRSLIAAGMALGAASAALAADESQLRRDRPESYTVQKGDTLWGISGRFLNEPWRWPELWRMNRDQVRNPHRIYPGNVLILEKTADGYQLRVAEGTAGGGETTVLSPQIRESALRERPVPSIPAEDLEPWLTRSLVVSEDFFAKSPRIVSVRDQKLLLADGDAIYAFGIDGKQAQSWNVYRRGAAVRSIRGDTVLGYNAVYLGTARLDRQGDVSRLLVRNAEREIIVGDVLVPAPALELPSYVPRAPEREISGYVVQLPDGIGGVGKPGFVTLDLGRDAGIEAGHVLAVYRQGGRIRDPREYEDPNIFVRFAEQTLWEPKPDRWVNLPDDRIGLVFVFRVFDRTAYGVVIDSELAIEVGDRVRTPPRS